MPSPIRRGLLPAVLVATFMGQFDFFVVNVAAPSIQRDLGASGAQIELVVAAYALTYAAGLVTGGRLGDLYGRRRVFLAGLVAFAVTSLACGVAPGIAALIAARSVQGLAGAVMLPQVLAFLNTVVPVDRRPAALGWFGVASGLGSIAGQVLGGWLVEASPFGLGWRTVFLVNVPVMVAAVAGAWVVLPRSPGRPEVGLDPAGAAGLFAGMALLVGGITLAQRGDIASGAATSIVGALVGAAVLRFEAARARAGRTVTVDPRLFTLGSLRIGGAASGAFMACFASFMFVLTLTLQSYAGLDPLHAGLVFLPSGVTFMLGSMVAPRTGLALRSRLLLGLAVTLTGLGNGFTLPGLLGLAMPDVPPADAGMASGTVTTIQQFAAAAGVAALGAVFYAGADRGVYAALQITLPVQIALVLAVAVSSSRARR